MPFSGVSLELYRFKFEAYCINCREASRSRADPHTTKFIFAPYYLIYFLKNKTVFLSHLVFKMQHISVESLEDLPSRIAYLSSFLNLTAEDGEALLASAPLIAPLVPSILEVVYRKLLSFDITAQAFVPKNTDFEGETVKSVGADPMHLLPTKAMLRSRLTLGSS
jgi:hypothetical protein